MSNQHTAMPRVRSQLALQLPPELIARIRAEAHARGQTITVMVAGWLEAALEAPGAGPAGSDLSDLSERVGCLEQSLQLITKDAINGALGIDLESMTMGEVMEATAIAWLDAQKADET